MKTNQNKKGKQMTKKFQITSLILFLMVVVVSCSPKSTSPSEIEVEETVPEVSVTGEASVDNIGVDISESSNTDEELDSSELEDIDSILADIENI